MTHHTFDFSGLTALQRYKILCGVVVPRPIALVTSVDSCGRVNAAPFSFFNVFSDDPAQIVLGLQHRLGGERKDTTRNLAQAAEFAVNMVDEPLAETMNLCAIDFPSDVSEVEALGIETRPGICISVPNITAAPFALECRKTLSLTFSPTREILIGEVLAIHARQGLIDPNSFYTDPERYRPIGRLAGTAFCRQGETFSMTGLSYDEWAGRKSR